MRELDENNGTYPASPLRGLAAAITTSCVVVLLALAIPAFGAQDAPVPTSKTVLQSLVVSSNAPSVAVVRDNYHVTVVPRVRWPISAQTPAADGFGPRHPPCARCSSVHRGVDFEAAPGTIVYAIASGTVSISDRSGASALGVYLTISHNVDGQSISSTYGHLQAESLTLGTGNDIERGQPIGLVGSTGLSTGPHLHFEIRIGNGSVVDPVNWLTAHAS